MLSFGTFLVFLAGAIILAGIMYLMVPHAKKDKMWKTILNWVLFIVICLDLAVGISFIYINMQIGHAKATSTAVFVFIGSAVVLAVIWARLMGFLGGKKEVTGGAQ